jgi:hypothetical protein
MEIVTSRAAARRRAAARVAVAAAVTLQVGIFLAQAGPGIVRLLSDRGPREEHLARRWKRSDYYLRTAFVVENTPPDSLIILPPQHRDFAELGNRGLTDYFLFPRLTAHVGDAAIAGHDGPVYRVVVPGFPAPAADLPSLARDETFALARVRDRRAPPPAATADFVRVRPSAIDLLDALVRFGLLVGAGLYVVVRHFGMRTWPGVLASSALVGMTVHTVVMILGSFAVPAIPTTAQLAALAAMAAPSLLLLRASPSIALGRPRRPELLAAAGAVLVLSGIFAVGATKPLVEWDSLAIWGIKARAIFATNSLRELSAWGAWPEYPPLVPAAMALLGVGGETVAKALFPVFACCLYALVYEATAHLDVPKWARILAPLPILLAKLIFDHAQIGYANLPLTAYVLWTVVLLARWLSEGSGRFALPTAVAASGMVLARPDGEAYLLFAVAIALAWILLRRQRLATLAAFALPVAVIALWKAFFVLKLRSAETASVFGSASAAHQLVRLMLSTLPRPSTIAGVLWTYLRYTFDPSLWGVIPAACLAVVLSGPRRIVRRYPVETVFLALTILGLVVLALYMAPSWGIVAYFNITMARMCMVAVPLMYLLTLSEVARYLAAHEPERSAS